MGSDVLGMAGVSDRHPPRDSVLGGSAALAGVEESSAGWAMPDPGQAVQRRSVVDSGGDSAHAGTAAQPGSRGMNWRVGRPSNLSS